MKSHEEVNPIHCFECYFTPIIKLQIPECTIGSSILVNLICPNEHTKEMSLEKFIDLTQKNSFLNIRCHKCQQNYNADFVYCKVCKKFFCQNCSKICGTNKHYLFPFTNIDSICNGHTQKMNVEPQKKGVKNDINNKTVEMKKGDWICQSCGTVNFQKRNECFKCKSFKQGEEAVYYCNKHFENFCQKCYNNLGKNSIHELKLLKNDIPSKEKVDKFYDEIRNAKNYIQAIEDNFFELTKNLAKDSAEFQSISEIFSNFKKDNTNLIQLIKNCILSFKQHFFNNNIGIQVLHNLLFSYKIISHQYAQINSLSDLEIFLLNTKNYIISRKEEDEKKNIPQNNNSINEKNPLMPLKDNKNVLKNLKVKRKVEFVTSNIFSIHRLKNLEYLIIFGKLYKFDFASLYDSKFKLKTKDLGMKLTLHGEILSNEQNDILFLNKEEKLLKIYAKEKSYKKPKKFDCTSFNVFQNFLAVFHNGEINLYIYAGNGEYQFKNKIFNTEKEIISIHFISEILIYANSNFDSMFYNINSKEENLIKVPIIIKLVHSRVIIGYSYNQKIIVIGIKSYKVVQEVDMESCFDCARVDENSFLSQSKDYILLWNIRDDDENIELIGRYQFDTRHAIYHILSLPNKKFILYKEYDDDISSPDDFPDDESKSFNIYSFNKK